MFHRAVINRGRSVLINCTLFDSYIWPPRLILVFNFTAFQELNPQCKQKKKRRRELTGQKISNLLTNAHFVIAFIQSLTLHTTSQFTTLHNLQSWGHTLPFFPNFGQNKYKQYSTWDRWPTTELKSSLYLYTRATVSTRGFLGGKRAIRSQRIVRATAPSSLDELLQHSIQKLVLLCTFFQPSFLCQTAWSFYVFQSSLNRAVDFSWGFFLNFS